MLIYRSGTQNAIIRTIGCSQSILASAFSYSGAANPAIISETHPHPSFSLLVNFKKVGYFLAFAQNINSMALQRFYKHVSIGHQRQLLYKVTSSEHNDVIAGRGRIYSVFCALVEIPNNGNNDTKKSKNMLYLIISRFSKLECRTGCRFRHENG